MPSPREVRWERMFPDELEAAFAQRPLAWLAYGLCEPHGPHNALGLDALRSHGCCVEAARRFGGIVAPPFYWHVHEAGSAATWAHEHIGNARPWLTAYPAWFYFKSLCYHLRAIDALGFHAAVAFSGHSGAHRADTAIVLDIMQKHLAVRVDMFFAYGTTDASVYGDGKGHGRHAGRSETSLLWALEPHCVDMARLPAPGTPGPHFALGQFVETASREAGEKLVDISVTGFIERAKQLLAEYQGPRATTLTFGDVETIWADEIRPRLKDFQSMQEPNPLPPDDSRWRANCHIPPTEGL